MISYSMSLSADGYIAGPDGSFDWAVPSQELHRFHNERAAATDAQLLGRRLYETMLVWDTEEFSDPVMAEFAEIWRPLEKIVFSTTMTSVEGSNRLATGTLEEEIAALGDRRIAVGGAGLAAECMRRGLIDEFELFVIPIVVGGGTPYWPPDVHIDLELVETRTFGATVYLHYRRCG
jgi:dihydrofolate reductase